MSGAWRTPWDADPSPAAPPRAESPATRKPKPRGRRPAVATRTPQRAPDWRSFHLTVHGPGAEVEDFATKARGAGVIPWQLDFSDIEETVFALAVAQPAHERKLSVEGCRILARQFRDAVAARQARALARVGVSRACPLDLHTLLPVPAAILALGPSHPTALAWLATHWGLLDLPRQVVVRADVTAGRRLPRGHAVIGYGFFTHGEGGETPQAALDQFATRWPNLRFALAPRSLD